MNPSRNGQAKIRCAIYTRKSSDEGLDGDFTSLDAQRESAMAYIASQQHEGWICLPERYDDGGYSGGNMDRPALRRLLADIQAGRVDCAVTYKLDRLSRSLLDFARIMEIFDKHRVSFVSVTQLVNSATSMGRLMLNVLLSFAQFEREIIAERTRDKMAAARRKGKRCGGMAILGYNVDPQSGKLVVNEEEAALVRAIYGLYLRHDTLALVVQELARRGWVNKRWVTRKGRERGGRSFTKSTLHKLLTNVTYVGKVCYKRELHAGEQAAVVDEPLWQAVRERLHHQARTKGAMARNRYGALLKGLLHCVGCGRCMSPTHCSRNGSKRYRYYFCRQRSPACPSRSVPALEIERCVIEQIQGMVRDALARASLVTEVAADESDLAVVREGFGPGWSTLPASEQVRALRLLVERVDYDGSAGQMRIRLRSDGITSLARDWAEREEPI
jgi:site-specific DNA recombinase